MDAHHQKNLSFELATPPTRVLDPDRIRPVLAAVECRSCARLSYQSMTSDAAADRVISPHSLIKASGRWHVRAFDYRRMAFIDLSLSRIASSHPTEERQPVPDELDEDWHTRVGIEFVPHPALSEDQRRMVASEFGMKRGVMKVTVRRALLFYTLDELRLLTAVKRSDSGLAKGATLWIQNSERVASELEKTRFDAS
jgi:predicted DNA-binding transcriptional regulator YafY